jgi:hypothetical protein
MPILHIYNTGDTMIKYIREVKQMVATSHNMDIAVLLVSAKYALSEEEIELLQSLCEEPDHVIVL